MCTVNLKPITISAGLVCSLTLTTGVLADATIESIAPGKTVLIAGAKNAARTMERTKETSLWSIWQSDPMTEYREKFMEEMTVGLDELYEQLDVEEGSLTAPSGAAGFAVYVFTDEEMGTNHLGMLAMADYNDDADKTHELIKAALERGEDDDEVSFEESELLGKTMYIIDLPAEEGDDADMGMGGGMPMMPAPDFRQVFGGMESMYLVRCDDTFLMGTEQAALRSAIERMEGEGSDAVSSRDDFRAAMSMVGDDPDAYGIMLTQNFSDALLATGPEMGMVVGMGAQPFNAMFGRIGAVATSIRLDGRSAMVEQNVALYLPEGKRGLFSLLDSPEAMDEVPPFINADAVSLGRVNFDFGNLARVAKNIIDNTPMLGMQMGPEAVDQTISMIEKFTRPLGSRVYFAQAMSKPITPESVGFLVAMECKDPQAFQTALAEDADMMEPRDFLGHTIYSAGPNDDMNLGIGGQSIFIGPAASVEAALRAVGNDDASTVSNSDAFQRGMSTLGSDRVVAWGYSDTVASMEASYEMQQAQQRQMIAEIREFDPAFADQMEAEMEAEESPFDKLGFDFLREHLGPSVWDVRSVDNGFVMRSFMLDAGTRAAAAE